GSVIVELEGDSGSGIADSQKKAPAQSDAPAPAATKVKEGKSKAGAPVSSPTANRQPPTASDILVPDIGDFKDVEVIDVLVKVGDAIEVDTPLLTLETEKATIDVPATSAGNVKSIAVKKGDRVSKGSAILTVES